MPTNPSPKGAPLTPPPIMKSPFFEWLVLGAVLFVSLLFGQLVTASLMPQLGILDYGEALQKAVDTSDPLLVSAFRVFQAVGQFFLFTLPPLLFVGFLYRHKAARFLHLHRFPPVGVLLLGLLLLILAFPFTQACYWLMSQLPLPTWMMEQGETSRKLVAAFLDMDSTSALWMNLLAMAVFPAVGEELMFRGVVQKLIGKSGKNPHRAIWVTAALFSFIHFEALGFVPRLLLGALLGYLLFWTNNLWVPIIAHLAYNASQI
ncbi:MAG: CPBP family intramembrane glutamic endopeptidase, partial [Bacteroidota bacterium]